MTTAVPHRRDGIEIRPVHTRRDRTAFIRVPKRVYRDDPTWVSPLELERRLHLSERFNPYFRQARWRAWLAFRDGLAVGRITAQVDERVRERHGGELGQFGFLDAVDDPAVFDGLLEAAEAWLVERGSRRIQGPFNFSINHECGLLVEGFDRPPTILMGHARPYMQDHLARRGYRKAKDLLAYWIETDFPRPPLMRRLLERYSDRIDVRSLDRSRFGEELERLRGIFNDAWSGNWGFVPFSPSEFEDMGRALKLFVPDDFVPVAEVDGEAAAFLLAVPNLNQIIGDLEGRLFPFGWLRLLRRVRAGRMTTARVALMGVRRRYQGTPLGAALALTVIDRISRAGLARGVPEGELSWILEDNEGMREIIERMVGGEPYKRYRIFEKRVGGNGGGVQRYTRGDRDGEARNFA